MSTPSPADDDAPDAGDRSAAEDGPTGRRDGAPDAPVGTQAGGLAVPGATASCVPPGLPAPLRDDGRLLAFDKPSGLLSVPGIGPEKADCLVARAQEWWPGARIVHRLDRDTSGVIVLARDADTHRFLSIEFQERRVAKRYVAVVAGTVAGDQGEVDLPIRKDLDDPPRQRVCHEHGRPSLTRWRVLDRAADRTRLEVRPVTGRSHQLRLHFTAIGHPILGDDLYGDARTRDAAPRLLLHAERLELAHPDDASPVVLSAPPPF